MRAETLEEQVATDAHLREEENRAAWAAGVPMPGPLRWQGLLARHPA